MRDLFSKVLQDQCRVSPGSRILVGCSGGADSTALLVLLCQVRQELALDLHVAHFDHALRPESAEEASSVADLAASLDCPCHQHRQDVAAWAATRGENLEAAGRALRRAYLQQVQTEIAASHIALGHHKDDQAETVLFRLLRGSGTTGLSGMSAVSPPYIRPLLNFSRVQLRDYLHRQNVSWCEDESNGDLDRTRNRLRHQVLPQLAEIQVDVADKLVDLAQRLELDESFWQQESSVWIAQHASRSESGLSLSVAGLEQVHPALRARVWLHALRTVVPETAAEVGQVHVAACEALLSGKPQGGVDLPGAWVGRRYDELLIQRRAPECQEIWSVEIPSPGQYELPDGAMIDVSVCDGVGGQGSHVAEFSFDDVPFPLQVRNRRPGDVFHPSGAAGSRKLKKFLIDAKVSLEKRQSLPLLWAGKLLWIAGLRRCEGFWPEAGRKVVRIEYYKPDVADKPLEKRGLSC